MKKAADLLLERVIALVEPLTRFDSSSVVCAVERTQIAEGTAVWSFVPEFRIERGEGSGSLPGGIRSFTTSGDAEHAARAARDAAQAQLRQRLSEWSSAATGHGSALTAAHCFDGPQRFGATSVCGSCSGAGQLRCSSCGGQRRTRCVPCSGSGKAACRNCGGRGTDRCGTCGGAGQQTRYVTKQVWDGYNNRYVSQSATETTRCSMCMGTGSRPCFTCNGGRHVTCWGCAGSGYVNCGTCGATGSIRCSSCNGNGKRHQYWTVQCSVSSAFETNVAYETQEVVSRIRSFNLETLRNLATMRQNEPSATATSAQRNYSFSCQVCEMIVDLGETQSVRLAGYGESVVVFDYKNVVGVLLEDDLKALEQAVSESSQFSFRPQQTLIDAVQLCLQSEANAQIGEGAEGTQRLKALGGLSEDYAQRLTSNLRSAFRRLYFSQIAPGAAVAIVIPPVLFLAFHLLDLSNSYVVEALCLPLLASGIVYGIAEFSARRGMKNLFGSDRITALLRGQNIVRRWRLITAGSALMLFLAMVLSL